MRLLRYREGGRAVEHYGSRGFAHFRVGLIEGSAAVGYIELEEGGVIGRHPAAAPQLLMVVDGSGYASGADGTEQRITAGEAVYWELGEEHETRTDQGLVAVVVEAESLQLG